MNETKGCSCEDQDYISVLFAIKDVLDVQEGDVFDELCRRMLSAVNKENENEWSVPCCINVEGTLMVDREGFNEWAELILYDWEMETKGDEVQEKHRVMLEEQDEFIKNFRLEMAGDYEEHVSEYVAKVRRECGISNNEEARQKKIIRKMAALQKKDTWAHILCDAIQEFQNLNEYTPNAQQLWSRLHSSPPKDYDISYTKVHGVDGFQLFADKHLDKDAFIARYNRLYPPIDEA